MDQNSGQKLRKQSRQSKICKIENHQIHKQDCKCNLWHLPLIIIHLSLKKSLTPTILGIASVLQRSKHCMLLKFKRRRWSIVNLRFCLSLTTSSLGTPCSRLLSSLTLRLTSCLEGQRQWKVSWYLATCWLLMIADSSPRIASSAPGSTCPKNKIINLQSLENTQVV